MKVNFCKYKKIKSIAKIKEEAAILLFFLKNIKIKFKIKIIKIKFKIKNIKIKFILCFLNL